MRTIINQDWNFGFFHKVFFKITKSARILTIFVGHKHFRKNYFF